MKVIVNSKVVTIRVFHAATGKRIEPLSSLVKDDALPVIGSEKDLKELLQKELKVASERQILLVRGGARLTNDNFAEYLNSINQSVERCAQKKQFELNSPTRTNIVMKFEQELQNEEEEDEELNAVYVFVGSKQNELDDAIAKQDLNDLVQNTKQVEMTGMYASIQSPKPSSLQEVLMQFSNHKKLAKDLLQLATKRVDLVTRMMKEIRTQREALKVLYFNAAGHKSNVTSKFLTFKTVYQQEVSKFLSILKQVESDIKELKSRPLHRKFKEMKPTKQFLINYFDEQQLREAYKKYDKDLKTMVDRTKFEQLSDLVEKNKLTAEEVQEEFDRKIVPSVFIKHLNSLKQHQNAIQVMLEVFEKDHDRIASAIQQNTSLLTESREISKQHEETIDRIMKDEQPIAKLFNELAQHKFDAIKFVLERVKYVATVQINFKRVLSECLEISKLMNMYKERFWYLERVHCIPAAYSITLLEIVRRNQYRQKFNVFVTRVSEKCAQMREDEIAKRKLFFKHAGKYVPPELVPGLDEDPPLTTVSITSNETTLPDIVTVDSKEVNLIPAITELASKSTTTTGSEEELKALYVADDDKNFERDLLYQVNNSLLSSELKSPQFNSAQIQQQQQMDNISKQVLQEQEQQLRLARQKAEDLEQSKIRLEQKCNEQAEQYVKMEKDLVKYRTTAEDKDAIAIELQKKVDELKLTILSLQNANRELTTGRVRESSQLQDENKTLKQENNTIKQQCQDLEYQLIMSRKNFEDQINKQSQDLSIVSQQNAQLRQDCQDYTKQITDLELESDKSKQAIQKLDLQCSELTKKLHVQEISYAQLVQESEKAKQVIADQYQSIQSMQLINAQMDKQRMELQNDKDQLAATVKQITLTSNTFKQEKTALEQQVKSLTDANSKLEKKSQELESKSQSLQSEVQRTTDELNKYKIEVSKLLTGQNTTKQNADAQILSLTTDLQKAMAAIKDKSELIVAREKQIKLLEQEALILKTDKQVLESKVKNSETVIQMYNQVSQHKEVLTKQVSVLQESLDKALNAQKALIQEKKMIQDQLDKTSQHARPLSDDNVKLKQQLDQVKMELEQTTKTLTETQNRLTQYKNEYNLLTNTYKYLQQNEAGMQDKYQRAQKQVAHYEKLMAQVNTEINRYKLECDSATKTIRSQDDLLNDIVDALALIPNALENQDLCQQLYKTKANPQQIPHYIQSKIVAMVLKALGKTNIA